VAHLLTNVVVFATFTIAGCSLDAGAVPPGGGGGPDSSVDSATGDVSLDAVPDGMDSAPPDTTPRDTAPPPDAPPGCASWMPRHFDACAIGAPAPGVTIEGTYDTDTGMLDDGAGMTSLPGIVIDQDGTPARLLSVESFTISSGSILRVVGSMPLIVASWSGIEIAGEINVSSRRGGFGRGAGSSSGDCDAATSGAGGNGGTGGGGGGGFGGRGGNGGQGDANGGARAGGMGGAAVGEAPEIVRGGCHGADSGLGDAGDMAAGGPGGGAVQLSARDRIVVSGIIDAGGGGAAGGTRPSASGGGGGGSGGYIGLDAPAVAVTGTLAANGGGGGGGAAFAEGGGNGGSGRANDSPASGGAGAAGVGTGGGPGGAGGARDGGDVSGILDGGGGGGGGGVGFVLVFSAMFDGAGGTISPAAAVSP